MNTILSIIRRLFTHRFAQAGALLAATLLLAGCRPESGNITQTTATLYAIAEPAVDGDEQEVTFEWGETSNYTLSEVGTNTANPFTGIYSFVDLTGLKPGTTYHWHFTFTEDDGTPVDSGDQTFTTDLPTFVVNTLNDTPAANAGDGTAHDANAKVSLRSAIQEINASAIGGKIIFDATVFATAQTITLGGTHLPTITINTIITGPAVGVTISGNNLSGVFAVDTATVSMEKLTITGGNAANDNGGAIENNAGDVTLTNCTLSDNQANVGGAIYNGGTLTLSNSTFSGNHASGSAGTVANFGTVIMTNCIFASNYVDNASNGSGGVMDNQGVVATLTNCTFAGNHTNNSYGGGAFYNSATLTLLNCTVTGNSADGSANGGGAIINDGTLNLGNTIVAGNTATGSTSQNISGAVSSQGYNLIGDGTGATGFANGTNGDQVGTTAAPIDPLLDPNGLQNNGGPTMTIALQSTSPAIDAGDPAGTLAIDQRGYKRPADGPDANTTKTRDIGAFEFNALPPGTYVVDNATDTHVDDLTTLREAIFAANADGLSSTISFDATVFATPKTITLSQGELLITSDMTINGPPAGVTVDGNHQSRIFTVNGGTSSISGLTITNGNGTGSGGAGSGGGVVANSGDLTLRGCTVINNNTPSGAGGGLANFGTLTLTDSTVANNTSTTQGGGIYSDHPLTVTNCTISGNHSDTSGLSGGGINSIGSLTMANCTITGNTCAGVNSAGGLRAQLPATVSNTIIAGNTGTGDAGNRANNDVYGTFTTGGYNLIGDGTGADGFTDGTNGDQVGTTAAPIDPLLDPNGLQNNGGPTMTIALQSTSPAIDKGDPNSTLTRDQRGYGRPVDGPDQDSTATIDIGAFEFGAVAETTPPDTTITDFEPATSPTMSQSAKITFTGSDNVTAPEALTFEGRLDSDAFATVTSPVTLGNVPEGSHTYEVRARDAAGNVDASSASKSWIVDRTAPTITAPGDIAVQTSNPNGAAVDFNVSANDAVDTTPTVTANPASGSNFPIGPTTVTVTATDDAGNQSTATFDVTVTLRRVGGVIAAKGQHVEGEPEGTNYYSFGVPSLNADGTVACTVRMKVGSKFVPAIVVGSPPTVFVRVGDEASGTDSKFVKFDDVLLNQNGQIAFTAKITGKGTTDAGLWTSARNNNSRGPRLRLVARESDAAPGVNGAKFSTFTSVALGDNIVAFTATLSGVGGKSNNGLWIDAGSGPTLALHDSGPLNVGHETKTVKSFVALSALAGAGGQGNGVVLGDGDTLELSALASGGLGQVIARAECTDGSRVVIVVRADGTIEHIAAKGDTAPDSDAAKFASFSEQTQSTDGRAAFIATLTSGEKAIFAESESVMTLTSNVTFVPSFELRRIVAEGDQAQGAEGAHYSILHNPVNNDQGDVAWIASLTGQRAQTASGIWWDRGGRTFLVAREGDKASGANGVFHQFKSLALSGGPDGAPLFTARLRNSANIGLWAVDAAGDLRLLMQEGDKIDLGGTKREVKTFTVLSLVRPSNAQTRSYAGGAVILRVTFTGAGGQALITVPVPEPDLK